MLGTFEFVSTVLKLTKFNDPPAFPAYEGGLRVYNVSEKHEHHTYS